MPGKPHDNPRPSPNPTPEKPEYVVLVPPSGGQELKVTSPLEVTRLRARGYKSRPVAEAAPAARPNDPASGGPVNG